MSDQHQAEQLLRTLAAGADADQLLERIAVHTEADALKAALLVAGARSLTARAHVNDLSAWRAR